MTFIRTSTFLDPDTLPLIDRAARHYGISRSEWIRRAVAHALEHEIAGEVRRNHPEFRVIDGGKMLHAPKPDLFTPLKD